MDGACNGLLGDKMVCGVRKPGACTWELARMVLPRCDAYLRVDWRRQARVTARSTGDDGGLKTGDIAALRVGERQTGEREVEDED